MSDTKYGAGLSNEEVGRLELERDRLLTLLHESAILWSTAKARCAVLRKLDLCRRPRDESPAFRAAKLDVQGHSNAIDRALADLVVIAGALEGPEMEDQERDARKGGD